MIENICQSTILVIGAVNAYLYTKSEFRIRRWAYLLSLVSQPAWFYTSAMHDQWGLFFVSIWFTLMTFRGIWIHWMKPWVCGHIDVFDAFDA